MALTKVTGDVLAANVAIASPVFSGTAIGTYTLAGTPTITAPVLSGTATGTYTLAGTSTIINPTLTLQSENVSPYIGFRNHIINGGFGIWQRGTSLTTSSNDAYGFADRWSTNLGASTTFSRSTDVPSGFQYSVSCAGTMHNGIAQKIESVNCYDLVGQTITVSFYARRTSGSAGISINLAYANSPDNFSSTTTIVEATVIASPSASWTKYSYTTSSVLPAGVANGLKVILFNGSIGSDTTLYTGVQLERGTVATQFEFRSHGEELILCQRYYEKSYNLSTVPGTTGFGQGGEMKATQNSILPQATWQVQFKVSKRTTPTFTVYNPVTGGTGTCRDDLNNNDAVGTTSIGESNAMPFDASGSSAGFNHYIHWTASAEL